MDGNQATSFTLLEYMIIWCNNLSNIRCQLDICVALACYKPETDMDDKIHKREAQQIRPSVIRAL